MAQSETNDLTPHERILESGIDQRAVRASTRLQIGSPTKVQIMSPNILNDDQWPAIMQSCLEWKGEITFELEPLTRWDRRDAQQLIKVVRRLVRNGTSLIVLSVFRHYTGTEWMIRGEDRLVRPCRSAIAMAERH